MYVAQVTWFSLDRLAAKYAISLVEPQLVAGAMRVATGDRLYRDYRNERPVIPLPYGVLEYVIPGLAARLAGHADAVAILHFGRSVSLASGVGVLAMLAGLARQRGV